MLGKASGEALVLLWYGMQRDIVVLVLHWFEGSWPRFSTLLDMFALQFELDSSSQRNAGSFLKSGGAGVVLGAGVWVHLSTKG